MNNYKAKFVGLRKKRINQELHLVPIRKNATLTLIFPSKKYRQLLTIICGTNSFPCSSLITLTDPDEDKDKAEYVCGGWIPPKTIRLTLDINSFTIIKNLYLDKAIESDDEIVTSSSQHLMLNKLSALPHWVPLNPCRVLVITTQYPYYGGAATSSYRLIQQLRNEGLSVAGVFVDPETSKADPEKIGGVFGVDKESLMNVRDKVIDYLGGCPNLVYGKNYLGPIYAQKLFPLSHRIFLVSGSAYATLKAEKESLFASQILDRKPDPELMKNPFMLLEKKALRASHQIFYNSLLTKKLFEHLFSVSGQVCRKPLPPPKELVFNWSRRPYHLAFISSKLDRQIKNYRLFRHLCQQLKHDIPRYRVLVIGEGDPIIECDHYASLTQSEVINLLQKVKILVIPSLYDSNPNVAYEAVQAGCKLIVSPNVGVAPELPSMMVCDEPTKIESWVEKIKGILN